MRVINSKKREQLKLFPFQSVITHHRFCNPPELAGYFKYGVLHFPSGKGHLQEQAKLLQVR
jgi:hypothetical protein